MPKHLHLRDFFATGEFFGLTGLSTRDDVSAILGPPDYDGFLTRKYKRPRIWVYGGIGLTFGHQVDSPLELIHFDHPNLPPRGSDSLVIDPWVVAENAPIDSIAFACRNAGVELSLHRESPVVQWRTSGTGMGRIQIKLASGLVSFDAEHGSTRSLPTR